MYIRNKKIEKNTDLVLAGEVTANRSVLITCLHSTAVQNRGQRTNRQEFIWIC